ncbi:MAG TPA: hypothetical protein VFB62_13775 [Polyangiaceae bacterium]|nr:hypothetical protein [Polyangiaceae bacterium]
MAKPFTDWTVLPHGKLTHLDDNMLTVTGTLKMPPMGDVERRMTIVRLRAGRLMRLPVRAPTSRRSFRWTRPPWTSGMPKKIGLTGDDPHIAPPVKMRLVKDEEALRKQLESWSRLPSLQRVIVAHGPIITHQPARVLGRIAQDLAA